MPALEMFLRRLRFPGVPGAPAVVGVPVDRAAEAATELGPVFALLADAERHALDLVEGAHRQAAQRRAEADEEAMLMLAEARAGAGAELSRAAAACLEDTAEERRAILGAAQVEAERVDRVARDRLPAAVDAVVRAVVAVGGPAR